ncbi:MAG TPA: hypothetical protein VGH93_09120 [Solirubrobacteraceae bacterium]|jgi:hypothetical protein
MKRPVVLIVGAAAGALLVAAVGASAHTGFSLARLAGVHSAVLTDEASGARTESPEPTETPEAPPTAEPAETPEPAQAAEPADNDTETSDDNEAQAPKATSSGDHEGGDSGGGHDD